MSDKPPLPPLPDNAPLPGSFWTHTKTGNRYAVVRVGYRESDLTFEVAYQSLSDGVVFFRPLTEFMDGRFTSFTSVNPSRDVVCEDASLELSNFLHEWVPRHALTHAEFSFILLSIASRAAGEAAISEREKGAA